MLFKFSTPGSQCPVDDNIAIIAQHPVKHVDLVGIGMVLWYYYNSNARSETNIYLISSFS